MHRIYCFFKQRSRKHELEETFTVLHASWRRHSTFDPRTVKTTAGIYKEGEKGASLPRWNLADGRGSLLKHSKFIGVIFFFFTTFHQQQLDLTPMLTIAELASHLDLRTDVAPHSASTLFPTHCLFLANFQHLSKRSFESITRLFTLEMTPKPSCGKSAGTELMANPSK